MRLAPRKWWPILKAVFGIALVVVIGRQFARDLQSNPDLWQRPPHLGWLLVSGALYLLGLGFPALFWYRLLRVLGQRPSGLAVVRGYYIGHLGKYLPGKAWGLFLRATLVRGPGVRLGAATLTTFYEVLTTMTAGVALASVLFALQAPDLASATDWKALKRLVTLQAPDRAGGQEGLLLLALLLAVGIGLPLLPGVFNRVVGYISLPFQEKDPAPRPRLRLATLLEGLLLTSAGWLLLGASLWAVVYAVLEEAPPLTWAAWGRYTASVALAYVAGFVILIVPAGLGPREFFLRLFLVPELSRGLSPVEEAAATVNALLVVLLLRLVWTAAEVLAAAAVYPLPTPAEES